MAIAFRSQATLAGATRTNSTVSTPAGAVNGSDVLVASVGVGNTTAPTISTPTGWTLAAVVNYGNTDPYFVNVYMFVRVHDGSASFTFNHSSGYSNGFITAWSGVDTATPLDTSASTNFSNSGTTTTAVFTAITIATAGAQLIGARGSWDGNAITPPGSWTERLDTPVLWVGDIAASGVGTTGSINVPHGNGTGTSVSPWGTVLAALRPDLGGGGSNFSRPIQRRPERGLIMRGGR